MASKATGDKHREWQESAQRLSRTSSPQQPRDLQSTVEKYSEVSLRHTKEDDEKAPGKDGQQSLTDSEEPQENLPLEFSHGTTRRRQILSDSESSSTPDEDADSAAPTAMTPADPTADPTAATTVPSQGTVAQIIFGTAAPTTPIVSNKAINRRTANDYAGTRSGMVFSCLITGCEQPINEAWTIKKFSRIGSPYVYDPRNVEFPTKELF
ncbi:hypothetical protein KCU81_g3307, partial [Aureobasidium melanogenum]|uniref:Uncharacterized protein n=1 Tax=Aureobasidium melanogenum (strain CBS 110374) TaxID=1043003 RepID=A0A074VN77_AURM1